MKRILCLCVIFALVICMCGCENQNNDSSVAQQYKTIVQKFIDEGDTENAKKALEEGISLTGDEDLKNMYEENFSGHINGGEEQNEKEAVAEIPKPVMDEPTINSYISEEKTFIDFDTKQEATIKTLPSVNSKYMGTAEKYAVVDLDGDGVKELMVEYNGSGDTAILRLEGDKCVAYYIQYRARISVKADGSMNGSSGAASNSIHKVSFDENGLVFNEVVLCDGVTNTFRVNGKVVTEEDCGKEFDLQNNKSDVFWNDVNAIVDYTGEWATGTDINCSNIIIYKQEGNRISMEITAIQGEGYRLAVTDVCDIPVENNMCTFDYEDTFGNIGTGKIVFSDNSLYFTCDVKVSSMAWGIDGGQGEYFKIKGMEELPDYTPFGM